MDSRRVADRRSARAAAAAAVVCALAGEASAGRLSDELEYQLVADVGFGWVEVQLDNSYAAPVPVCTTNLPSAANASAIPRIRFITGDTFEVRIQSMPATNPGYTTTVHCLIAEEGTHTLSTGLRFQALTETVSDVQGQNTPGGFAATAAQGLVDVSARVSPGFTNPAVLGAVISNNDTRASAFFSNDCDSRSNPPFASGPADGICVSYHIGQQSPTPAYAAETVGVIIFEPGAGAVNNVFYEAARGPDAIDGVGNGGGAAYAVGGDFEIGIATQAGEQGGQGGWAVLIGADPLPPNQLRLAVEEETVAGDTSRSHVTEIMDYWVFRDDNAPQLTLEKTSAAPTFSEPGETVSYSYLVENTGDVAINELAVTDNLIPVVACPVSSLAASETTTCTGEYVITPADISNGAVTNTASAAGVPMGGVLAPASDAVTITFAPGMAALNAEKTVEVFDAAASGDFHVPGVDVLYMLRVVNAGAGEADDGSIFLVDELPPEVAFFTGDVDGPGPFEGSVGFEQTAADLTFDPLMDLGFSRSAVRPTSLAECGDTPGGLYDATIRFICFRPRGAMAFGEPDPEFQFVFRARIQ